MTDTQRPEIESPEAFAEQLADAVQLDHIDPSTGMICRFQAG